MKAYILIMGAVAIIMLQFGLSYNTYRIRTQGISATDTELILFGCGIILIQIMSFIAHNTVTNKFKTV